MAREVWRYDGPRGRDFSESDISQRDKNSRAERCWQRASLLIFLLRSKNSRNVAIKGVV